MTEHDDFDLGFDPADAELGRRLRAAAPAADDPDRVLTGLRPQLVRARRRRQVGVGAISAAAMALFAGIAFVAIDDSNGAKVRVPPANRSTPAPTVAPSPTTVPVVPPTDAAPGVPTTPTTVDDRGGDDGNRGPGSGDTGDDDNSGSGSSGSDDSGSDNSGSGSSGSGDSGSGDG